MGLHCVGVHCVGAQSVDEPVVGVLMLGVERPGEGVHKANVCSAIKIFTTCQKSSYGTVLVQRSIF